METWYARSVFFVTDMGAALAFYTAQLGFTQSWHHDEAGRTVATQIQRGTCEVILNVDEGRAGRARLFVSLEPNERTALEREIESNVIPVTRGWWGMPVLEIRDPDGNELLFPLE